MKHRFNKKELPFLNKLFSSAATDYDYAMLSYKYMTGEYFTPNKAVAIQALEEAAHKGSPWAMNQLFMWLIDDKSRFVEALSWGYKAAKHYDQGALQYINDNWSKIYYGIMNYENKENEPYATIEVKCAMLTALLLIHLGADDWNHINIDMKKDLIQDLTSNVCKVLHIRDIKVEISNDNDIYPAPNLPDGVAYYNEDKIWLNQRLMNEYNRLIQVIFHELGHHVVFTLSRAPLNGRDELFSLYGLTPDRIPKWQNQEKGYEITLTEEDPDTLSYGVWTVYRLLFPF